MTDENNQQPDEPETAHDKARSSAAIVMLPCPFCGRTPNIVLTSTIHTINNETPITMHEWSIRCENCNKARVVGWFTKEQAFTAWNQRGT